MPNLTNYTDIQFVGTTTGAFTKYELVISPSIRPSFYLIGVFNNGAANVTYTISVPLYSDGSSLSGAIFCLSVVVLRSNGWIGPDIVWAGGSIGGIIVGGGAGAVAVGFGVIRFFAAVRSFIVFYSSVALF
jgi:hypothetical protein